jgi:hypothetical protein
MLWFFSLRSLGMAAVMANTLPLIKLHLRDNLALGLVRLTGHSLTAWSAWAVEKLASLDKLGEWVTVLADYLDTPLLTRVVGLPATSALSSRSLLPGIITSISVLGPGRHWPVMEFYDRNFAALGHLPTDADGQEDEPPER